MKDKIKNRLKWILNECKDKQTLVIFITVVVIMYMPTWGGYLLHALFGFKWASAVASGYLIIWAGPFTPFFPCCIAITFAIKKLIKKYKGEVDIEIDHSTIKEKLEEKALAYDKTFWLFILASIAGVLIEGIFCLIFKGGWQTHVTSVFGAFNYLYGIGAVIFFLGSKLLRKYNIIIQTFILMIVATILELLAGIMLRDLLGMRAWNYNDCFLNYKGLICPSFSLVWGIAAFSVCYFYPKINKFLTKAKGEFWHTACVILTVFILINTVLTSMAIFRWSKRHYGHTAHTRIQEMFDERTPDEYMEKRFIEWEFLK